VREAFYILSRRIFLKTILADSAALKKRWPVDASEILTMYLIAENLVNDWDVIKDEFKKTKTLKDKRLLIAMMYQPGNCAMIHSPSGMRPTRSPYRQNIPCTQSPGCQLLVF